MNNIKLVCANCGCEFRRAMSAHLKNIAKGSKLFFCSASCCCETKSKPKHKIKCSNCGNLTENDKFCSRSCAASFANRQKPKRSKEGQCASCGNVIRASRKFCKQCRHENFKNDQTTLAELATKSGSRNSYRSNVGEHARQVAKRHNKLERCFICEYSTHVECCHIKPITAFTSDTPLSIVNEPSNLIGLCRNHHWELDHGLLDREKLIISDCTPMEN